MTIEEIIALTLELDAMKATPEQANRIIDRLIPCEEDKEEFDAEQNESTTH